MNFNVFQWPHQRKLSQELRGAWGSSDGALLCAPLGKHCFAISVSSVELLSNNVYADAMPVQRCVQFELKKFSLIQPPCVV